MALQYRINAPLTAQELSAVFAKSGIRRPVEDLPRLTRMIANANLTITAWEGETLVGVARALTDFSWCCYLSDLAVDRDYQKQGVGRELVERVRAEIGDEVALLLLSAPGAMEYYPKIGFEAAGNAWLIKRSI